MGKTVKLTIRLSPEEMALLKSRTAKTRLSQSAYLRSLIRGHVPKAYPPEVFYTLLERLTQACGDTRDPTARRELLDALRTLQETVMAPDEIEGI